MVKFNESDFSIEHDKILPGIGKHVFKIYQKYTDTSKVESFVDLEGAITIQLNCIWREFLQLTSIYKIKYRKKIWDFTTLIELLGESGVLSDKIKSKINNFYQGRNSLSHKWTILFYKKKQSKLNNSLLDTQFKEGIIGFVELVRIRKNIERLLSEKK